MVAFLFHLIVNHQRLRQKQARLKPLPSDSHGIIADLTEPGAGADHDFVKEWRDELLDRAWEALEPDTSQTQ